MLKCSTIVIIVMLLAVAASAQKPDDITVDADLEAAKEVKDYYADWLTSIPGVSAVRVANSNNGEPEIMVDVEQMTPQIKQIPEKLNGIPVVVAPVREGEGGLSSEPLSGRGSMPNPTPEAEISPAPTPQGNKFWPYSDNPFPSNPNP